MLQVEDVGQFGDRVKVNIHNVKGDREQRMFALPGAEEAVSTVVTGKVSEARAFGHGTSTLEVHSYCRSYAQAR
jgi:hypothetical protein